MSGDIIKLIGLNTGDAPADIYLAEKENHDEGCIHGICFKERKRERKKQKTTKTVGTEFSSKVELTEKKVCLPALLSCNWKDDCGYLF